MDKKPNQAGAPRPQHNNGTARPPYQSQQPRPGGRDASPRRGDARGKDNKDQHAINERIRAREVRLVGDNVENGVVSIQEALRIADDLGLDLIEISPNAEPPVCRVLDYQKFLYQQKKRAKEQKAKQTKVVVKEIRFGPQTDDHDYNFKLKHAISFLQEGSKVKAYVFFKGRSILFKEQGEVLLLRFANDLEEYGKVEQLPQLEGKKMAIFIAPKKAGVAKKSQQKMDRERREAEAKEAMKGNTAKAETAGSDDEMPSNGGLFANAKISDEALKKLTSEE